jgi:basic amino acid/polyamine antiporter, APA family
VLKYAGSFDVKEKSFMQVQDSQINRAPESSGTGNVLSLRREVTIWGSFMWGYADVGADIYAALGIVIAAAQGMAPLAFALAGLVYIMVGLAFTELASSYPVAGGGQYYSLRGLGDFAGYIAGVGLLQSYTIDIALFAVASTGYINFFFPQVHQILWTIGPFSNINPIWCLEALFVVVGLCLLNIHGVRESSKFNEILGSFDIIIESSIIITGFMFAWHPDMLAFQWTMEKPTMFQFLYGSSLAIISFVGLESISQAAQETRRPATIIPRTSLTLIFTVLIFAMSFSTLSLGILPWQTIAAQEGDPIATIASHIPYIGMIAGPLTAILGATILLSSSNTGVMGASRLVFSMSNFKMVSSWFSKVHPKYRTPVNSIITFSAFSAILTILSFLTPRALDTLGNLYAFGATLGYTVVFLSLIRLRFVDPYSPRPYKVPGNIKWKRKDGTVILVPIIGFIGFLGVFSIWLTVMITHAIGRIFGPSLVLLCLGYYFYYRKKNKLPLFGNTRHDWEKEQIEVLKDAEEFITLEQYKEALNQRDKESGKKPRWSDE